MQNTIIHTATRVIRRLTTDTNPPIANDETLIDTSNNPIDLAGGPWKLGIDNKTLSQPSQNEIDNSAVDENRNYTLKQQKISTYNQAVDDFVSSIDGVTTLAQIKPLLKAFLQAIKNLR